MSPHRLLTASLAVSLLLGAAGCGVDVDVGDEPSDIDDEDRAAPGGKADYFGEDDRQDPRHASITDRQTKWARATALMTDTSDIEQTDDGGLQLASDKTFGDSRNLCEDVRFTDQPVVPNCSSFLVAPDVMVTAGHCTEGWGAPSCEEMRFVFDFGYYGADDAPTDITEQQVAKCEKIVASTHEGNELTQKDYAVVKLTEPVTDREPLDLRSEEGHVSPGDHLTLIGYPDGLPVKVDSGGVVFHTNETRFVATNDSFAGHSGGAVLNTRTGEIEAVHVASGGQRFESADGQACKRPKQCQQANTDGECQGSIGVHTSVWRQHVEAATNSSGDA
ncbi:MAG: serine protease, partial [Bradymonadaceae bacterium]